MKKLITYSFLLLSTIIYSQENITLDDDETNEIIDELLDENDTLDELIASFNNYQFLYISLDYNAATYFSGRDIGVDQFSVIPQITYMHSSGFFTGLSGVYYDQFTPQWDYTALNLGYNKSFGKQKLFRATISYSRFFYSNGADNPFENTIQALLGVKNKSNTLGAQLSATLLFGNETSHQFTLSTYGNINLYKRGNNSLRIRPQLNFVAGKYTLELSRTFMFNGQVITRTRTNEDSGLINTQLALPLQYNTGNFDIELGYVFNIPNALAGETDLTNTSNFNFSIAYLIDLD